MLPNPCPNSRAGPFKVSAAAPTPQEGRCKVTVVTQGSHLLRKIENENSGLPGLVVPGGFLGGSRAGSPT